MRIPCPYCGDRDSAEFLYRGNASLQRPGPDEDIATVASALYLRDNPAGPIREHWYHSQGCRNWLIVERDTRTHVVSGATLATRGGR